HRMEFVHAAGTEPALDGVDWQAEILLPIGGERDGGEMSAGRVSRNIEPISIAGEASGVLKGPGDGAAHLVCHCHHIALRLDDIVEVKRYEVCPRINIGLRH